MRSSTMICLFLTIQALNLGFVLLFKRADLRWNRRLEDLEQLASLQDELLDAAST